MNKSGEEQYFLGFRAYYDTFILFLTLFFPIVTTSCMSVYMYVYTYVFLFPSFPTCSFSAVILQNSILRVTALYIFSFGNYLLLSPLSKRRSNFISSPNLSPEFASHILWNHLYLRVTTRSWSSSPSQSLNLLHHISHQAFDSKFTTFQGSPLS